MCLVESSPPPSLLEEGRRKRQGRQRRGQRRKEGVMCSPKSRFGTAAIAWSEEKGGLLLLRRLFKVVRPSYLDKETYISLRKEPVLCL